MTWRLPLTILLPALLAGSATAQLAEPVSAALAQSRAEFRAAQAEAQKLEAEAGKARDKAGKLAAERKAAAAGLLSAEAEISALNVELVSKKMSLALARIRLEARQAPAAALVAGLVNLGRRPPILAIADRGSMDELVKTRLLLDATLPAIRARTAGLAADLAEQERLVASARTAASRLSEAKAALVVRQEQFATLEAEAEATARALGSDALEANDRMIAARDSAGRLDEESANSAAARRNARQVAALGALPPRPFAATGAVNRDRGPAYVMPATAPVVVGLGSVNRDGVRARGVQLATPRGTRIVAPAAGSVAFNGPFRRHDGIVIIDHGGGWMTMLIGVRGDKTKGGKVARGEDIGVALGDTTVEYSQNGRPMSAPLAAVRSLSIQEKRR
jgi:septal ring factor EnvC (AmiA/AmiB activator)